jgi:hypothetical protein
MTDSTDLTPPEESENTAVSLMQHAVTLPEFQAAFTVMSAVEGGGSMDIGILLKRFGEAADAINNGNMEGPERMAISQAKVLEMLFHELLRRGMANLDSGQFEPLIRLALRAQAQSAKTLETLAVLKKPPVFANQVNMANQQVINNGLPSGTPSASADQGVNSRPTLEAESPNLVRLAKTPKRARQRHALD